MRRIAQLGFLVLLATLFTVQAWAGTYMVVVQVADGANIKAIADAYSGKVVDSLDDNTYLVQVKLLTPKNPVSGILWMESNQVVGSSKAKGAVVSVKAGTTPDWYSNQPAFSLIRESEALALS